jgi:hypothetical protein
VDRGGLDERKMAYRDRIQTYQRIRTIILRDAWLIDHDHREDEREDGVEEEVSDAACLTGARWQFVPPTAEQSGRSHQSDNQDHGSGSGHADAPLGKAPTNKDQWCRQRRDRGREAKASGAGHGRMKTNEKGEPFEDPGKTAESMMGSMNRVMRYLRDQR